jgi:plastocyanin
MRTQIALRSRTLPVLAVVLTLVLAACNQTNSPAGSSGPAGAGSGPSIVDFAFNPASFTVAVNTPVTWTNTGTATHTVTADDGSFDSQNLSAGKTYSHTFSTAGTFTYHCAIHSSMKGTIVVTP